MAAAAIAVPLCAMGISTSALGACKTTLRGELVQAQTPRTAFPGKFLSFSLSEITQDNRPDAEKRFQAFVFPNARTTLPIPFVLEIDSPKDCPDELELNVSSGDSDVPVFRFASWQPPLHGQKSIRLGDFASIPVWGPMF
jgi:hypothetical protein